ncbi:inorganic triphosphatase [Rheinheimera sp.]|uniref:CYTH domain-containing protein n=1 Tax=Rheinheimera sp. TaxID=1869214 RepID=UPI0027344070|nr:CYTH domain-containing protein [Rheinheimera sp.]MDP2716466.1 CYTH domain-containing protein [Rheinheimera sp.]
MSTELELKFLMPPRYLAQLIAMLPQLGTTQSSDDTSLLNAYFETKDRWFRRHDMGLRSRLKRGRYEQTIKLAGSQHGAMQMRPEYNVPCAGVEPQLSAFPAHIWPAGTDIVQLQQQITELFRTDFTRKSWQLQCSDGSMVELVYDQGQVLAGTRTQPIAELELELLSGDAQQLFNLARQLLQHLPLVTGWQSKAARGYGLAAQQPLTLPRHSGDSLLAQINALQQAAACYQQQSSSSALAAAAQSLAALADSMQALPALQQLSSRAAALATQLRSDDKVLAQQDYHLLLLAVSEYLYHNG